MILVICGSVVMVGLIAAIIVCVYLKRKAILNSEEEERSEGELSEKSKESDCELNHGGPMPHKVNQPTVAVEDIEVFSGGNSEAQPLQERDTRRQQDQ